MKYDETLRFPFASITTLILLALSGPALAEVEVTTCGQVVTHATAVMNSDLDCSAYADVALHLNDSKLVMNGHTITSNPSNADPMNPTYGLPAVYCDDQCQLVGPGTITGAGGGSSDGAGMGPGAALSGRSVKASEITLEYNGGTAVGAEYLKLDRCTIRNNAGNGVYLYRQALVRDCIVENNGLRGILSINGVGGLHLLRSSVKGHPGNGIVGANFTDVRASIVTGNGTDPNVCDFGTTGDQHCADIEVFGAFRFRKSQCDTSYDAVAGAPAGVCTRD